MIGKIHIYTDGGSRGNPGPGASAFIAVLGSGPGEKILHRRSEKLRYCTNNEAEYRALIMGLEWAVSRELDSIEIHSDSELMIKHLNGDYRVRADNLLPLYLKARNLLRDMRWRLHHHRRSYRWISRCDRMVNEVLDHSSGE